MHADGIGLGVPRPADDRAAMAERLWPALLGGWALAVVILLAARIVGIRSSWLSDPDDAMRLLEVRDWLGGQSWWDVSQHRLWHGAFSMHWSRLVDLPIALVITLARPLLGEAGAERLAMIAVPMGTLLVVMALSAGVTRRLAGIEPAKLTILLAPLSLPLMYQLRPLRIDHHGWQVAAALAAVAALLREPTRLSGALAGLSLAVLLTISLEGLPISAAILAVAALFWVLRPERAEQLGGLLMAFVPALLVLHVATRGPGALTVACDAMSPPWLAAAAIGSIVLALGLVQRPTTLLGRLLPCALGAAAGGGTLLQIAPQCAAGPFGMLDPLVRQIWYMNIAEGLPIWRQVPTIAAASLPVPIVGLVGMTLAIRETEGAGRERWLMLGAIAFAGFVAELFVIRASATACALALPGASVLLLRLLQRARAVRPLLGRLAATGGALLVATPSLAAAAVTVATLDRSNQGDAASGHASGDAARPPACFLDDGYADVRRLPAATLFAPLNVTPSILAISSHRAVAGGYHRNTVAIHAVIAAFAADPEQSRSIVAASGATYVVACADDDELAVYAAMNANGLWSRLARGEPVSWLRPVPLPGSPLLVWRVIDPPHRRLPPAPPRS